MPVQTLFKNFDFSKSLLLKFNHSALSLWLAVKPKDIKIDDEGKTLQVPNWYVNDPTLKDRLSIDELTELELFFCIILEGLDPDRCQDIVSETDVAGC